MTRKTQGKGAPDPGEAKKSSHRTPKTRAIGRPMGQGRIGKQTLIEKTVDLLRTTAPEKLSLSMAARHAKVHLTLFKYYFTDRTRLLVDVARALAKSFGDDMAAIEAGALPAPERFRIRVDAMVDFLFINPYYHRLMLEIVDQNDPLASELISFWISNTVNIYKSIIESGVAEGSLRPIDPYFSFLAIMGLCEQYHHASRFATQTSGTVSRAPERTAAEYKAFVYDLIMKGFGASAPLSA